MQRFENKWIWRELHASDERRTFEKQSELTHREPHAVADALAPQRGEASLLETLGVNAQARAVPKQDLGSLAGTIYEKEHIARERIAAELKRYNGGEAIEAFPLMRCTA